MVWNADIGEQELEILVEDTEIAAAVEFSPDGTRILGAMQGAGGVGVWDAQSGEMLLTILGHADTTSAAAFSPDGTLLATASHDLTIRLWDAENGQELLTLFGPAKIIRLKFSPDGRFLATQSADGATRIYVVSIADLMVLAESRLTRSLTDDECQRYLHLETCP